MQSQKLVLLVNLGSPEELSVSAIRKFLSEFLSDKRVVGLSRLIWYPILFGVILPFRARKLLHSYQKIWLETDSSPLTHYTKLQAQQLQHYLGESVYVDYAFTYGSRSISAVLSQKAYKNCKNLIVIPLYPQYSSSTTASVYDQLARFYADQYFIPKLKFINSFAGNTNYIKALADTVRQHWTKHGRAQKLIVSFHSIPLKLIYMGDSYLEECQLTYHLLCNELNLVPDVDAKLTFQSKFGKAKWLEPATASTVTLLAKALVESLDVICPGFISDCLETLEEIAIQNRELFINSGGKQLNYICCLNDSIACTEMLAQLAID